MLNKDNSTAADFTFLSRRLGPACGYLSAKLVTHSLTPYSQVTMECDMASYHIGSFNYMSTEGIMLAARDVPREKFRLASGDAIEFGYTSAHMELPVLDFGGSAVSCARHFTAFTWRFTDIERHSEVVPRGMPAERPDVSSTAQGQRRPVRQWPAPGQRGMRGRRSPGHAQVQSVPPRETQLRAAGSEGRGRRGERRLLHCSWIGKGNHLWLCH